jgi:hypothetical protein
MRHSGTSVLPLATFLIWVPSLCGFCALRVTFGCGASAQLIEDMKQSANKLFGEQRYSFAKAKYQKALKVKWGRGMQPGGAIVGSHASFCSYGFHLIIISTIKIGGYC